jgi:hypothetical protein
MRTMSSLPSHVRRAVQSAVGGLPVQFWFLWTGILINRLGAFVFPLLALSLTRHRGFSASRFAIALYGVGNVAGRLWRACLAVFPLVSFGHLASARAGALRLGV